MNAICARFPTIVLDGFPILTMDQHNEAKRVTNLIDCVYENGSELILTNAESTDPTVLFKALEPLEHLKMSDFGQKYDHDSDDFPGITEIPAGAADQDTSAGASGVLQAINKKESGVAHPMVFNEQDKETLEALSFQAAQVMERIKLQQEHEKNVMMMLSNLKA